MASPDLLAPSAAAPSAPTGGGLQAPDGGQSFAPFGDDGFTFADLLDIVNPLQHIPVVGTLYRHITGDTLDAGARVIGGALFGGPIGIAVAGVNALLKEGSGRDAGEHVLAVFDGGEAPAPPTAVADGTRAVPDLALLGPLPVASQATPNPDPHPAAPLIDLAALAPLAPAAASPIAVAAAVPDADRAKERAEPPPSRPLAAGATPPGAAAADGGWFTETMLAALEKYQEAARLAAN